MSNPRLVIDSSVLLSGRRRHIEWLAARLLIPIIVCLEVYRNLDSKREARAAWQFITETTGLAILNIDGSIIESGNLEKKFTGDALFFRDRHGRFLTNDEAILVSCRAYRQVHAQPVMLVTDDVNMRLKGRAYEVPVASFAELLAFASKS